MFNTPDIMRMAQDLARYSGARQTQIAKNIANTDTPGYRARDFASFADALRNAEPSTSLRMTRANHTAPESTRLSFRTTDVGGEASPNGNTVSLETEMVRATDAKSSHELALTVYSSSLDIIRTALGRGR